MEKRTKDNPWKLKTPPGTSDYEMYVDTKDGKEILVCTVGTTVLHYDYRALEDLHAVSGVAFQPHQPPPASSGHICAC